MSKKQLLNATQIRKELTKCKINPNGKTQKDAFDRMLVDVNNMDFYILRSQELISHMRLIRESTDKNLKLLPIAQQYKKAQDIIKLLAVFCAYAIKEYPQLVGLVTPEKGYQKSDKKSEL